MKKSLAVSGGQPVGKVADIPWPVYDQTEIDAVTDVVKSRMWGIGGPRVPEFEEQFAAYCGVGHGIAAVNGTLTLRLALEALGVGPGDEVIVPGMTFQATAASVLDVNAMPILTDIDPETFTLDPAAVEAAITPRTRCIIPVHLYGRVTDMDAIMAVAGKHKLAVLEDCAHQHGSEWDGRRVGSIGDIGSFSLQAYKTLNAGEGGILTTSDDRLGDLLRSLRNIGLRARPDAPAMQSGNYRMTEFQAAILMAQLARLDGQIETRDRNVLYMEDRLRSVTGVKVLKRHPKISRQAYFRWFLRYIPEQWDDVPLPVFIEALDAELEGTSQCARPYEPLNSNSLYRPHTKKTHHLSDAYWADIDPARFHLPACERVFGQEAFGFFHRALLADRQSCDNIVNAIFKLRENSGELADYAKTRKEENES